MKNKDTVLDQYIKFTRNTAKYPGAFSGSIEELVYLGLGMSGEAGEVAGKLSKVLRDNDPSMLDELRAELGDVLWFWARLCDALGVKPDDIIDANMKKLTDRKKRDRIGGSGDHR